MTKPASNILIVEDEKLLNWSMVKSLSKLGFEVHPVFNGVEAMHQVQQARFDIVLLDYQLPDLDGLEVARRIRQAHPGVAIVLVTAFQLSELDVTPGLIDAYLNKPVDLGELHRALLDLPGVEVRA